MMPSATLRAVGGSVMVAIPKVMLDDLGLSANAKVDLRLEAGAVVLVPQRRRRYQLAELIGEQEQTSMSDQEWDAAQAYGAELL
jgi:antitoxin ChpS